MGLYSFLFGWLNLGICRGDLVLEVGSGGRPLARSNVLCDMFIEDGTERAVGAFQFPIVADRPFVCANAERLPFEDDAFDYLLSAHLVEHLLHPELFLQEAMRVSRAGYFVTPSEFRERILPDHRHLWMVSTGQDGTLVLKQKRRANESEVPGLLHKAWSTDRRFRRFYNSRPDLFETRFFWKERFSYQVVRHEERPSWFQKAVVDPDSCTSATASQASADRWQGLRAQTTRAMRSALSRAIRRAHSGRSSVDLHSLLVCPVCRVKLELATAQELECAQCHRIYPIRPDGIPILLA